VFEVIVTLHDDDTGKWVIRASDRDGERAVMLAETDDQEQADNIIATIAKELGATDLGRQ
jgi:hypothetical protein